MKQGTTLPPRIRFSKIAWLFVLGFAAQFVIYLLFHAFNASLTATVMASIAANALCWIAGYELFSFDADWGSLTSRFRPVEPKVLWASAAAPVGLVLSFSAIVQILVRAGVQMQSIPIPAYLTSDLFSLPLQFLVVILVGPFAEELMFRGLLLDWLKQNMPVWAAVLAGALLFGLAHGVSVRSGASGWAQLVYRVILGLVTSLTVLRFNSLRPSFVLHAANNAIALAAVTMASNQS
ncbi:MAG: CPBP family intramembrane metalloprotease [Pseudomonadota bacterium]|nr:CPBP family intramembrane metalloprotease [Pseudomonadota bacterium]